MSDTHPRFACDAMLGGLARWLWAAGHDATWRADIADWDLIRLARAEDRVLLSCDTGIFKIGTVRDAVVASLFIPHGMTKFEQLQYVFEKLDLCISEPRCMSCGGELEPIAKSAVKHRAPPRTYAWVDQFFECTRCRHLFWKGTHWQRIASTLSRAQAHH